MLKSSSKKQIMVLTTDFVHYSSQPPENFNRQPRASHFGSLTCRAIYSNHFRLTARERGMKAAAMSVSLSLAGGPNSFSSLADLERKSVLHSNDSTDPSTSGSDITTIHSPEELAKILATKEKLICLMCKAIGCRPCKMFTRKYQRVAMTFKDCIFLDVTGDETTELRKMMIQMGVKATPTFRIYRNGECVKVQVGIDEDKLRNAIKECCKGGEAGA